MRERARSELPKTGAAFFAAVDTDARIALAAPFGSCWRARDISSQLIDNLNASIHLRALLTDLFVVDEALKSRTQGLTPDGATDQEKQMNNKSVHYFVLALAGILALAAGGALAQDLRRAASMELRDRVCFERRTINTTRCSS